MSGVYIKGMKMPTSCSECACCSYYGNGEHMCDITEKVVEYECGLEKRRDDCPLVPVPPHGHWVAKEDYNLDIYYDCSVCGESWDLIGGDPWDNGMNYCPHCGARMDGAE